MTQHDLTREFTALPSLANFRRVCWWTLVPDQVRQPRGGAGQGRRLRAPGVAQVPAVDRQAPEGGRQLPDRPVRHPRRGPLLPDAAAPGWQFKRLLHFGRFFGDLFGRFFDMTVQ